MGARAIKEVEAGKIVKVAGVEWVVLDHIEGKGTLCLMKDILEERAFHEDDNEFCNNWANSTLREWLNSESGFAGRLMTARLAKMMVDLTSDDGMKDYGTTEDYIFLLSADQYRKYRQYIPNADDWWWLVTPWSCNSAYSCRVRRVHTGGTLDSNRACLGGSGVRPALVFDESVIEDDDNSAERSEAAMKNIEEKATKALCELNELKECIEDSMDTLREILNEIRDTAGRN